MELIGGQSRRETVVSQTPRIGSLLCSDLPGVEVDGDLTGVFESQLTNNSAATISALAFFIFDMREKLKELRVISAVVRVVTSGEHFRTIGGEVNRLAN
jgi:hypothetical protein